MAAAQEIHGLKMGKARSAQLAAVRLVGAIRYEKDAKFIQTNLDIVSDIFFMLTRYEEAVSTGTIRKDIHGRFPATESLAYKRKFLHRPIVNEHIELLWSWIEGLSPRCP